MRKNLYYSRRTNKSSITEENLSRYIFAIYEEFEAKGFFVESFGFICVDEGHIPGSIKFDVRKYLMRKTGKDCLWPICDYFRSYKESDIFDIVEFLFDTVSAPLETNDSFYHPYSNCGWHYQDFDKQAGQFEFQRAINEVLIDYKDGFELTNKGEIQTKLESGLDTLFHREISYSSETEMIQQSIEHAKKKYWDRNSTPLDRKDAIVRLGLILEPLKRRVKNVLRPDEDDLFNILNNFGLRHSKNAQKTDYESRVFDSWLFYHYLAAVHAYLKLLDREKVRKTDLGNVPVIPA